MKDLLAQEHTLPTSMRLMNFACVYFSFHQAIPGRMRQARHNLGCSRCSPLANWHNSAHLLVVGTKAPEYAQGDGKKSSQAHLI